MELNDKHRANIARLRAYYPYRRFFLAFTTDGDPEGEIWALRDKRAVNQAIREGATIYELSL